jgi:hypothetical protein
MLANEWSLAKGVLPEESIRTENLKIALIQTPFWAALLILSSLLLRYNIYLYRYS